MVQKYLILQRKKMFKKKLFVRHIKISVFEQDLHQDPKAKSSYIKLEVTAPLDMFLKPSIVQYKSLKSSE